MKKPLAQKQTADYAQLSRNRNNGWLLPLDELRFICEVSGYDPEAIGRYFLGVLAKIGPP